MSSAAVERISPVHPKIRGVAIPECINEQPTKLRKSPAEGPYTPDQLAEATRLFNAVCEEREKKYSLLKTAELWIGIPMGQFNRGTMQAFIDILKTLPRGN